jgi:hypothetical protein
MELLQWVFIFYSAHFYWRKFSIHTTTLIATKDNPSSVTELESDVEDPPPVPPPKDDLSSITKPESEPKNPLIISAPPALVSPKDDLRVLLNWKVTAKTHQSRLQSRVQLPLPKRASSTLRVPQDLTHCIGRMCHKMRMQNGMIGTDQSFDIVCTIKAELRDLH